MIRPESSHAIEETSQHHSFVGTVLEAAGVWGYVTLAVVALALVLLGAWLQRDLGRSVNPHALAEMLKKCIASDNVGRAIKMCTAMPDALACQLALIGLQARQRNENPTAAMRAAYDDTLRRARAQFLPAAVVGVAALVECFVMVIGAEAKHLPSNEVAAICILPALVFAALAACAVRWNKWPGVLETIIEATGA
jgi:hypothetical protein